MILILAMVLIPIAVAGCGQQQASGASWAWQAWIAFFTLFLGTVALATLIYTAVIRPCIKYRRRPILKIQYSPKRPDFLKTLLSYVAGKEIETDPIPRVVDHWQNAKAYWIRFKVNNEGIDPAENVEAYLAEVRRKDENGTFKTVERFIPGNLRWSDVHWDVYPRINRELPRHFDVGHIVDPSERPAVAHADVYENPYPEGEMLYEERFESPEEMEEYRTTTHSVLVLDMVVKRPSRNYILLEGHYMLRIMSIASNAALTSRYVDILFDGCWDPDFDTMWREHAIVIPVSEASANERVRLAEEPTSPSTTS